MEADVPKKAGRRRKEAPEERDALRGPLGDPPARSGRAVLGPWVFGLPHRAGRSTSDLASGCSTRRPRSVLHEPVTEPAAGG